MSAFLSPLGYQLGIGGVAGFIAGYLIKKISRLIIILFGFFLALLVYLGFKGVISINSQALIDFLANLLGLVGQAAEWLINVVSLIPLLGSFAAGFLLGLKLG